MTPKKPERVPAFPFYATKWLGSAAVTMLDATEEGTYIRLLAHQWVLHTANEGKTLPADPSDLRRLTKLDTRQWKAAWKRLEEHFPVAGAGRMNPTMEAIWAERRTYIETQTTRGEKGGRPKRETREKPTGYIGVPEIDGNGNPIGTRSEPEPKPGAKPEETSVSVSVSELPNLTDVRSGSSGPPDQPPTPSRLPPGFDAMRAALTAAALPHEALALEVLVSNLGPAAYAAIGELHAIATGMHPIRGADTGRAADATDVMRALAEMVGNGSPWNMSYFRGHVRRLANRAPEPATAAERQAAKLQRAVDHAARMTLETLPAEPDTPEQAEARAAARREALAKFKAEFHRNNPDAPAPERRNPETPQ